MLDEIGHWMPHVMIYVRRMKAALWGANVADSPVAALEYGDLDPVTIFLVPVSHWSDGTVAPEHH